MRFGETEKFGRYMCDADMALIRPEWKYMKIEREQYEKTKEGRSLERHEDGKPKL